MSKKIEKLFKSYRDQQLHLAKLYGVVEIKSYARSSKRLTITQLELLLIKNHIKLPTNRSSDKAIAKQELKENTIRNIYCKSSTNNRTNLALKFLKKNDLMTCPAHQWQFDITTGECITVDRCDDGCMVDTYPVKIENDEMILSLPL